MKSKFVSVVIPPRKWQYVFLGVYYKTSVPLYHHHTEYSNKCSSNIRHMSNLMLFRTVELRAS